MAMTAFALTHSLRSLGAQKHIRRIVRCLLACASACLVLLACTSCVNQHPETAAGVPAEDRLIATSPAVAAICDKLDLNLIGIPKTAFALPERYADVPVIGPPMGPDMELVAKLHPSYLLSPLSLQNDLLPRYIAIGKPSIFLDLNSVDGLYNSLTYVGNKFNRSAQAHQLVEQYHQFMNAYQRSISGKKRPRVLLLMGVPGSYIVATPHSYVGSLVALAGGENVYSDSDELFLNANTEDMLARDPDIILRTSHALPDDVMAMFAQEFSTNDIWKHFRAVKEHRVYDLAYDRFGMSATFAYPQALFDLRTIFYEHVHGSSGNQAHVFDTHANGEGAQANGNAPAPANGNANVPANGNAPAPANGNAPAPANGAAVLSDTPTTHKGGN